MLAAAKEQALKDAWRVADHYRYEWEGYLTVPSIGDIVYQYAYVTSFNVLQTILYEGGCDTVDILVKGGDGTLTVNREQMHDALAAVCDYLSSITAAYNDMKTAIRACTTLEELQQINLESLRDSIKFTH